MRIAPMKRVTVRVSVFNNDWEEITLRQLPSMNPIITKSINTNNCRFAEVIHSNKGAMYEAFFLVPVTTFWTDAKVSGYSM